MNEIMEIIKETQKLTLLYVEDNKDTIDSSLLIFDDFFKNTIIANNGMEGLEKFKNNNIDIIITDINMPVMNGLKMIKEIRESDNEIPIIITSAYNETEYFQESIKLNIEAYMLKPINLTEFIAILKKVTRYINLRNENSKYINLLKQYQEAIDEIASISKTDKDGIITYINESYSKISGYTPKELIGKNHNVVRHTGNTSEFYKEMWETIKTKKQIWKGIVRNISKSGKNYYAKTVIKPILDNNNNIIEYIALRDNITNLMNHRTQIHDLITISQYPVIILIKIELFEDMEIYYGQNMVEEIEKKFSNKIFNLLPYEFNFDKVYILGDGIFALAKDIKNSNINMDDFISKFRTFQKVLDKSHINYQDVKYCLHSIISIGYEKKAFENAKYGLKKLKEKKQSFIIANNLIKQEQKKAFEHLEILKTIKYAIKNLKVISYFQPIINNNTMKTDKYESLVRIIDENNNILMPFDFLEIAKKTNYYSEITSIVLKNSIETIKNTNVDISVNISFLDIENNKTRNKILDTLNKNKDICSKITIELLEEDNIKDFKLIQEFIKKVKSFGVKIAIDDFGKGYSNFERLINYQPDILKLDGLLIKNIEHDEFSLAIVEMLVKFAQKQNIKVIAEYVENKNIFDILKKIGVDYSQGFYFGKPEPLN